LHEQGQYHGDLDCESILIDDLGELVIMNHCGLNRMVKKFGIQNTDDSGISQAKVSGLLPDDGSSRDYKLDLLGVAFVTFEMMTDICFNMEGFLNLQIEFCQI
jgi:hypothetical protein